MCNGRVVKVLKMVNETGDRTRGLTKEGYTNTDVIITVIR